MGVGPGGPVGLPLAVEPRPRIPLPGQWTFWADTMVGARPLGNVDVSSFYCVRRLSAFGHGNVTVNLPSGLDAGVTILVSTATLTAEAPGGLSRASYILPGSRPMLLPPASSGRWYLRGTGRGSVSLGWRSAWV